MIPGVVGFTHCCIQRHILFITGSVLGGNFCQLMTSSLWHPQNSILSMSSYLSRFDFSGLPFAYINLSPLETCNNASTLRSTPFVCAVEHHITVVGPLVYAPPPWCIQADDRPMGLSFTQVGGSWQPWWTLCCEVTNSLFILMTFWWSANHVLALSLGRGFASSADCVCTEDNCLGCSVVGVTSAGLTVTAFISSWFWNYFIFIILF